MDLHNYLLKHISDTNPKEEEELVQLNIALQKEIVRFTALGIQKAVTEIIPFGEDRNRSNSANNNTFFVSKN